MKTIIKFSTLAFITFSLLLGGVRSQQPQQPSFPERLPYPKSKRVARRPAQASGRESLTGFLSALRIGPIRGERSRMQKLSPELEILVEQFTPRRDGEANARVKTVAYPADLLERVFGIAPGESNPRIEVAVTVVPDYEVQAIKDNGGELHFRLANVVYAGMPLLSLAGVADNAGVVMISALAAPRLPPAPKSNNRVMSARVMRPTTPAVPAPATTPAMPAPGTPSGGATPAGVRTDNQFEKDGLSGRGVIVGVVDTGIDWRHPDFIKEDGTSRILYIWDMYDESYRTSGGQTGSPPPVLSAGGAPGPGTVYTKAQIDAALAGNGTVNSTDDFGHGTAVAGTAAGNGRASGNGVPAGTYAGVAPEADLIIVKAAACDDFLNESYLGTVWIAQTAQSLGRPFVANHSYGGHYTAHDGTDEEERVMNSLIGRTKPGAAITVSAGNDGELNFHSSGRFGPFRPGQQDFVSTPRRVTVLPNANNDSHQLDAYFDRGDDWGLVVSGSGAFLVDSNTGEQQFLYVYKMAGQIEAEIQQGPNHDLRSDLAQDARNLFTARLAQAAGVKDQVTLMLPPGTYDVQGFGATVNVTNGHFDLYLPDRGATFARGGDKKFQVGSPGNASDVITVGAYDFRDSWATLSGGDTLFSLDLGKISDYSNQGGRFGREVFKPELAAPATFTISSLSASAGTNSMKCPRTSMGRDAVFITRDGFHLAWDGTSAAAPFTAGVIALMLEKNPTLDSTQIKRILTRTASQDEFVGATPNPEWGHGRLNPVAALAATPPAPRNDQR